MGQAHPLTPRGGDDVRTTKQVGQAHPLTSRGGDDIRTTKQVGQAHPLTSRGGDVRTTKQVGQAHPLTSRGDSTSAPARLDKPQGFSNKAGLKGRGGDQSVGGKRVRGGG